MSDVLENAVTGGVDFTEKAEDGRSDAEAFQLTDAPPPSLLPFPKDWLERQVDATGRQRMVNLGYHLFRTLDNGF